MPKDKAPDLQIEADAQTKAQEAAEDKRLLYVALTRAEHELIIAGAGARAKDEDDWYGLISNGFDQLGAATQKDVRILSSGERATSAIESEADEASELPKFYLEKPPAGDRKPTPLAPSELSGDKVVPGGTPNDGLAALRGDYLHHLLDLLPKNPVHKHERIKARLRIRFSQIKNYQEIETRAEEVIAANPDIFDQQALSEVSVTAPLLGGKDQTVFGAIDRLIITDKLVKIVDFKSNSVVPTHEDMVPNGILAQMGAYADCVAQIYPDKKIELLVLWTVTGQIMSISHDHASAALKSVTGA